MTFSLDILLTKRVLSLIQKDTFVLAIKTCSLLYFTESRAQPDIWCYIPSLDVCFLLISVSLGMGYGP